MSIIEMVICFQQGTQERSNWSHPIATKWLLDIHVISIRCLQSDHQMIIMWIPCGYLVVLCLQVVVDLLPSCVNVVLKVTQPRSCRGEICPSRGDLLRSVPHIKFGDKIKSHRYLDHSGWLGLIYCSNYRDHWRLLLFELETKILWLLKSVCHTVTFRLLHASAPIKAICRLFMLPNATNSALNLEHISDFR